MDKTKKVLICAILIGIIIIVIIGYNLIHIMSENKAELTLNKEEIAKSQQGDTSIKYDKTELKNSTIFYTIEECINTYFDKIKNKDTVALLDLLNNDYISANDINTDNILSYVNEIYENYKFTAIKIYEIRNDNLSSYIVEGIVNNINVYFVVEMDINNFTYSITPLFLKQYNNIEQIGVDVLDTEIEQNDNNKFRYYRIKDDELISKYFNYYMQLLQSDVSKAYEKLDDEYKNEKFSNIELFNSFINNKSIGNIELKKYAKYKYDNYTQFVCIDNYGDYYIFNETATMQFKVLLDTYTIDQLEFIEKYETATDEEKAGYNVNKFIQAINAKDYNYAYNCLANSFKQNKFPTLNSFEEYVKNNFFENNDIESGSGREEGSYYIYTLNITDANNSSNSIQKEFIVNLKENREFEMSFGVE